MINTEMRLTQLEIRYLLEHTVFEPCHIYLKRYLENRLNELIRKEGKIEDK